jgi:hypothetical protein
MNISSQLVINFFKFFKHRNFESLLELIFQELSKDKKLFIEYKNV